MSPLKRLAAMLIACTSVASLLACGDDALRTAGDSPAARRLVGEWEVTFDGLPVYLVRPERAGAVRVQGVVALVPNHTLAQFGAIDHPTSVGSFDVNFTPMGFDPRDSRGVPSAAARTRGADSVELMLGTSERRPAVFMQGAWVDDSLVGRWALWSSRAVSANGTFVLQRRNAH